LQKTIRNIVDCSGIGLHSGNLVRAKFIPAEENTGICFRRFEQDSKKTIEIKANFDNVHSTNLCTSLSSSCGQYHVSTVEHLMAALWGCGIDNLIIELDADEIPIMDGSSADFVKMFEKVGVKMQAANKRFIEILKVVRVEDGDAFAELSPGNGFAVNMEIEFPHKLIEKQVFRFSGHNHDFKQELSRARTFGFIKDVEYLKKMGLAKGGSLDNAIVLDENGILNNEGLRFEDEFVRHKILDSIGDLYLAGFNIVGEFLGRKSGHKLNNMLLRKLFSDPRAWKIVEQNEMN
jgi:UDP-3-O-[3-hydroxymyristoyl] N-acetylglucosamine deacetylase